MLLTILIFLQIYSFNQEDANRIFFIEIEKSMSQKTIKNIFEHILKKSKFRESVVLICCGEEKLSFVHKNITTNKSWMRKFTQFCSTSNCCVMYRL